MMARLLRDAVGKLTPPDAKAYFDHWQADLRARLRLVDLAESIYVGPGNQEVNMAVSSLIHAADYLADRIAYEMDPAPKGMIRLESE
jgi:hypothetical protein